MGKNFFAIGFHDSLHPEAPATVVSHHDPVSLDDADIVLFRLPKAPSAYETYQGKPCLSDEQSFRYKDALAHWRRELANAIRDGKTVIVELTEPSPVLVATGQVTHSGTGRSRVTTRIVSPTDRYNALPFHFEKLTAGRGSAIKLDPSAGILANYWKNFGPLSRYEVRFDPPDGWTPLLLTSGKRCVGAMTGHVLVLPPVRLVDEEYEGDEEENENGDENYKESEATWSEDERIRSFQFIQELLAIESQLSGENAIPIPGWMSSGDFSTQAIRNVSAEIAALDEVRRRLDDARSALLDRLNEHKELQLLLYGKGRPLERGVRRALNLMGFDAQPYADGQSEFDALFCDGKTRMLGEVEGRDNSPIKIDKITQLERNIAEDFAREDVSSYAKGVLFGNPQRLTPPDSRTQDFTEKCRASAERNKFAVVLTATMFGPAAYLEDASDANYAAACRNAILTTEGDVVRFPDVPSTVTTRAKQAPSTNGERLRSKTADKVQG